ncbi:MAG: DUF3857 domain-containing protein [Chitinophagaceae bacterium]|nr:DUF3857 domain-containing protein [Chitinophagaceae bacterium]
MRKPVFILVVLCLTTFFVKAQEKSNIKFGKIEPKDFDVQSSLIDSSTNAIVIADIGSASFEEDRGWFNLIYKRNKRVKILNANGFDAATVIIQLYVSTAGTEKLEDLKAVTYTLENGEVRQVKLDPKNIFEEKVTKNIVNKKFTFPALNPGCIIEFSYMIRSDFFYSLPAWNFQGEYPCLWSEYQTSIPDFFGYVPLSQGSQDFFINKTEDRTKYFENLAPPGIDRISSQLRSSATVHDSRLVMKDVPALKEEPFTTTVNNYLSKVEYQLAQLRYPNRPVINLLGDWMKIAENFNKDEDFGMAINANNGFLSDLLKDILKNTKSQTEKAQKIFTYIQDNFTCTRYSGLYLENSHTLKDILKSKSGSVSELNLLLIAMLKHENISVKPVILSLRNRGFVHPIYPLMKRFNYLIAMVDIDSNLTFLDASRKTLGFGKLLPVCYNGTAWVIDKKIPFPVNLSSDLLVDNKNTFILFSNEDNGKFSGSVQTTLGFYSSNDYREKMSDASMAAHQQYFLRDLGSEWKANNFMIDSLHLKDEPIGIKYELETDLKEDILYINPMFGEEIKRNPFISAERLYPVEMPFRKNESFVLDMEIPKGYAVEEIPKSVRYKLNEDEGLFEYICVKSAQKIQLKCKIIFNKANFPKEDYASLREFYSFIIKKQSEQIVLKKSN